MSKTKQNEREQHEKAMEDFFKRGGKIEYIENGRSGQTFKGPSQTTSAAAKKTSK